MRTFLVWPNPPGASASSSPGAGPTPDDVQAELGRRFQPLFEKPLKLKTRRTRHATLVTAEVPVKGWHPSCHQADDELWAFAPDYPLNVRSVLRSRGIPFDEGAELPALARALEENPEPLLAELVPPFSLIWGRPDGDTLHVQTDGLGQSTINAHDGPQGFALTNRVSALCALGMTLKPVAREWAARFTIGWFPLDLTGIEDVRVLPPGSHVALGPDGPRLSQTDVLQRWVQPEAMSREECYDLACDSLVELAKEVGPLWDCPSAGLSGGWDSRAVIASLRAADVDVDLRVRGHPDRFDVLIAHHVATVAGLEIRVKSSGGQPPGEPEAVRRSFLASLQWQMGGMPPKHHSTRFSKRPQMKRGVVNVMGQHGGLVKADYVRQIDALTLDPSTYEDTLVDSMASAAPANLLDTHDEYVRDLVRTSLREGDRYGLDELGKLHFYYLNEFTRRWGSATVTSQAGLVYAPFLNPRFIRAAYAYPQDELHTKPFHTEIIRRLAPDWVGIPFTDTVTEADIESGRIPPLPEHVIQRSAKDENDSFKARGRFRTYHPRSFWKTSGRSLLEEAVAADGFSRELFTTDLENQQLRRRAYELVMAYLLPEALATDPDDLAPRADS
jgi:hypothetical protein